MKKFISAGHIGGASAAANHRDAIIRNTSLPVQLGSQLTESINIIYEDGSLPDRHTSILAPVASIECLYDAEY